VVSGKSATQSASCEQLPSKCRLTSVCSVCQQGFLKKNMKRHMQRQHGIGQRDEPPSVASILVDHKRGIFLCVKNEQGNNYPIHFQMKVSCGTQVSFCENEQCQEACKVAGRCNFAAFQCPHLKSAAYATVCSEPPALDMTVLDKLIAEKMISRKSADAIANFHKQCLDSDSPPVVWWQPSAASSFVYMSVYSTETTYYCPLQRVVVRFNVKSGEYDCACCARKRGCLHKKLAMWYMSQFHGDLITSSHQEQSREPEDGEETTATVTDTNSCRENCVEEQVQYITTKCRIPVDVKKMSAPSTLTSIEPSDSNCHKCKRRLLRCLNTNHGKLFDIDNIVTGTN